MRYDKPIFRYRYALLSFAVSIVLFLLFCFSLFYSLPGNVLSERVPTRSRMLVQNIIPQQFGFFTKDPREPYNRAYKIDTAGKVISLMKTPNNKKENFYGFSRKQRAQGPELANILNNNKNLLWYKCENKSSPEDCVMKNSGIDYVKITNNSTVPTLCGLMYITFEKTVDWSFRYNFSNDSIPLYISKVYSVC